MKSLAKLSTCSVVALLMFVLPASAEEIAGQWHALFDTPGGVQTYHLDFQVNDGKLIAKAVVETGDQKRDVEFQEATLDANTLKFVELRKFGDRELRIEYTGTLDEKAIKLVRRIGDFGSQESDATRDVPKLPPVSTAPVVEVHIDRIIRDAYEDSFRIGTAGDFPARYSDNELKLAEQHFNAVTPENCMKPERVHPEEDTWRFEQSDALVGWATENKMSVHGHTLVWHAQTRDWFFRDGDRSVITQRMKDHIDTLVGRYKGKVRSWDVVNEAINDGGNQETGQTENLRDSQWLQKLGPEFLTLAFKFAHDADPEAILYYNDYNIESGPKHANSMVLLKRLLAEGAPIDAVGIQGHWRSGRVPFEDIEKAITDYASLGLKVSITELDVTIRGESGGQFDRRRFRDSAPPSVEDLNAQAEDYAKLFAIFKKHEDAIERITFWGLNDRRTWRRGQHPLLFDANNNPKPAYASIVELTGGKDAQKASEPPRKVEIDDGGQSPHSALVTVDSTINGSISIEPPLPEDGRVPVGTKLKLTATPLDGYGVDSVYYSVPGRWGAMYHESLTGELEVVIDQDKHLGASFIKSDEVEHVQVTHNVVYAQPGKKPLKYDVYSPTDARRLPIIVIIHGGGWSTNDEDIMRGLARELTKGGKFVVASLDYRWIGDADGDDKPNSMADLIEDVFGGIAHIVEHAESYGGDPHRVGVTGDSAGGHLSASASLLIDRIGDGGFGVKSGVFEFKPTYLPEGKTSADIRQQLRTSIRAAAPSYGVFSREALGRFVQNLGDQASEAVAPQDNIPQASTRKVPQYLLRGTKDFLIRHEGVEAFVQALEAKGQEVIYEQVDGAGHAFFDWKPNEEVKATFDKYGVPYAKKMRDFFEKHLHSAQDTSASAQESKPVVFSTQQDHQNMLDQLGITKLRPGRNGDANAPNGANYDEAKANPYPALPEILITTAGENVTTPEQWNDTRRPELVRLLETHLYGRIPEAVPDVKWEVVETREVEAGGKPAIQKHIIGTVDNSACPEIEVNISMSLTLPKDAKGSVPVLMTFGWTPFEPNPFARVARRGDDDGARPPSKRDLLIAAGWGCAMINPSTIQDDAGGWRNRRSFGSAQTEDAEPTGAGLTRGIIGLTNLGQPRKPDQWGALRAWGWGASRALDYFEEVPEVDATRVGIAGVSRYGKAALVTMAFDERFAMGLIASSGAGGTALHRRDFGESLENLAGSGEYHWMCGNYLQYAAEESSFGSKTPDDLPVDSHMMLALCAPRLTFISHGIPERGDAQWLDHQGSFMAAVVAQPVYRLLGAKDLGRSDDYMKELMPAVNVDLLDEALAWRQHDGGHTDGPNVEHFIRWAESQWTKKPQSSANDAQNVR